jgi:hypothetical protein
MARQQKSPAKEAKIIEGEAVEKTVAPGNDAGEGAVPDHAADMPTHAPRHQTKALMTARAALAIACVGTALGTAALWQQGQNTATTNLSPSPAVDAGGERHALDMAALDARFAAIETRLAADQAQFAANDIEQKAALATLTERLAASTAKPIAAPSETAPGSGTAPAIDRADLDRRFAAIDSALATLEKNLSTNIAETPPAASSSEPMTPAMIGPLLASGLLADNLHGRPLDRWIVALQRLQARQGQIDHFEQVKAAAAVAPASVPQLLRNARDVVPLMAVALHQAGADAGLLERAGARLAQIVQLRPSSAGAGGNGGVLQRFETAIAQHDLAGALLISDGWEGESLPALEDWRAAAAARQRLDLVVSKLVADLIGAAIEGQ